MSSRFTEFIVEEATFTWLEGLGRAARHGWEIEPGELAVLCDALLPKLISGDLRVLDAKRFLRRAQEFYNG